MVVEQILTCLLLGCGSTELDMQFVKKQPIYTKESGAMNEGFSDIWGACVEYFAALQNQHG
jgi:hypothetical protein